MEPLHIMSEEGHLSHSHMEYESHVSRGSPYPGTEPQPLLLLEPTAASQSVLLGQVWEMGEPTCAADVSLPWDMGTRNLSDCEGRKFRKESRPSLHHTSLHTCPHVFMSTGWKEMSKNGNICTRLVG